MIEIREEFEVAASPEGVWKVMSDPYQVVGCLPGATLIGQKEDGTYQGSIGIKFGPTSVTFETSVALELNQQTREGRLTSSSKDKRGGTRSKATTTFSVGPGEGDVGSKVLMQSDVEISGPLAGLVENGAKFVVKRLVAVFAERLSKKCAAGV